MNSEAISFELSRKDIKEIRSAIEEVVCRVGSLEQEEENMDQADSYLKFITASKMACEESNRMLFEAVSQARRTGHSWVTIGASLEISRQAAQQRFGGEQVETPTEAEHERVIKGATAFNEMQILVKEGLAGYHLVSFGPAYLVVRSSPNKWEHKRVVFKNNYMQLKEEGWTYVGSWLPFRYYKRQIKKEL